MAPIRHFLGGFSANCPWQDVRLRAEVLLYNHQFITRQSGQTWTHSGHQNALMAMDITFCTLFCVDWNILTPWMISHRSTLSRKYSQLFHKYLDVSNVFSLVLKNILDLFLIDFLYKFDFCKKSIFWFQIFFWILKEKKMCHER